MKHATELYTHAAAAHPLPRIKRGEEVFRRRPGDECARIAIVAASGASITALAGVLDPLRLANEIMGTQLYEWELFSPDGSAITLSCGINCRTAALDDANEQIPLNVILLGGLSQSNSAKDVGVYMRRRLSKWIRHGVRVIAVDEGTLWALDVSTFKYVPIVAHWRRQFLFQELHPEAILSDGFYRIDTALVSCAGQLAAFDLMLTDILATHGRHLAEGVAETLLMETYRTGAGMQRWRAPQTFGVTNAKLRKAISFIDDWLEDSFDFDELSAAVGLSRRQLERLFQTHLGISPGRYRARARIERAQQLLMFTDLSFSEVAFASGFNSLAGFNKSYKRLRGRLPSGARQCVPRG